MTTAARAESTASTQNAPRQPTCWPAHEPSGTPTTVARPTPLIITPRARDADAGPAAVVATTEATDQNAPVTSAVRTRAARTTAKSELTAASTWPAAKTANAPTRGARRGRRSVAIAMAGAPTIIPTAKAVISSPVWDRLTPKAVDISGSSPATRYSVVHIRNVPTANSGTTNGNLSGAGGEADIRRDRPFWIGRCRC